MEKNKVYHIKDEHFALPFVGLVSADEIFGEWGQTEEYDVTDVNKQGVVSNEFHRMLKISYHLLNKFFDNKITHTGGRHL